MLSFLSQKEEEGEKEEDSASSSAHSLLACVEGLAARLGMVAGMVL